MGSCRTVAGNCKWIDLFYLFFFFELGELPMAFRNINTNTKFSNGDNQTSPHDMCHRLSVNLSLFLLLGLLVCFHQFMLSFVQFPTTYQLSWSLISSSQMLIIIILICFVFKLQNFQLPFVQSRLSYRLCFGLPSCLNYVKLVY